jgi:hypothetical protein
MDAVVTIEINGRNRYSNSALTEITVRHARYSGERGEVMRIRGGYIEERGDGFVLAAKHMDATDVEHDSSYIAYLEGAGLQWRHMMGPVQYFTGVILDAKFYDEEPEPLDSCDVEWCSDKGHGFLDFIPPTQKWKPGLYEIEIRYGVNDDE